MLKLELSSGVVLHARFETVSNGSKTPLLARLSQNTTIRTSGFNFF